MLSKVRSVGPPGKYGRLTLRSAFLIGVYDSLWALMQLMVYISTGDKDRCSFSRAAYL